MVRVAVDNPAFRKQSASGSACRLASKTLDISANYSRRAVLCVRLSDKVLASTVWSSSQFTETSLPPSERPAAVLPSGMNASCHDELIYHPRLDAEAPQAGGRQRSQVWVISVSILRRSS